MIFGAAQRGPLVYRLRPDPATDSYGDPVDSWTTPDRRLLRGATVQAKSSTERETVTADELENERVLLVPSAADVTEDDRIEVDSEFWRVSGRPIVRRGLAMSVYTSATLRRFTREGSRHGLQ